MCKQRLGALCGCQTNQARVWSILQPKAWCLVLWWVLCGCGAGLSYNQRLGYGAVGGCGAGISYIQALAWCLAWC